MTTFTWKHLIKIKQQLFTKVVVFLFVFTLFLPIITLAAAGVPKILNLQGRLLDTSGNLLGGAGTDYCFRFSLYDNPTVGAGTKLWPAGTPSTMTYEVRQGVFDASIGDTVAGGDALTYDFQTSDTVYINTEVAAQVSNSCTGVTFETLGPRQRVVSSAYAINSGTVGGFTPAQSATGNQIPALTSGALILGDASAGLRATGTTALTFQSGVTGDIQFFSGSNKITSSGALTLAGAITANGLTLSNFTTNGGVLYTNASGLLAQTGAGTANTVLHGGTNPSFSAVSLTADVSGILPAANGGTGVDNTGKTITLGGNFITSGAFGTTLTATGTTNVTLPTTGTLATLAGSEALTNKTINGLTITSSTGTLSVTNGKTLSSSNSLTLAGTDGTTMTFPSTSATLARTDAANTFTGIQTFSTAIAVGSGGTGATTLASNGILYGNGTGTIQALPVNTGATQCLTQTSSGIPAWGSCGGGGSGSWSDITAPSTDLTLAHGANKTSFSFNSVTTGSAFTLSSSSLTTGTILDLQSSGTAAGASQTALNILTTGANATSGITTYGARIANTHSGTTSTNVGLYATASGGTTANYAAVFDQGNVGIGTTTPAYTLDVLNATTGQTASNRVANYSTAGATFDTTTAGGAGFASFAGYYSSTSTRSAGIWNLKNIGIYATASGGDINYAAVFNAGNIGIGFDPSTVTLSSAKVEIFNNDSTYALIVRNGNVGIGIDTATELLTLGQAGTTAGVVSFAGATSGKAILTAATNAGTPTITLPTTTGTLALTASPVFTGTVTMPTPFTLGATSVTSTGTQLNYLASATGTTGTTSTNLVFSTSPTLVTPVLGAATATSINGLTISSSTGTLSITNGKTFTASNTLTLQGTDGSTLNIGAGGTLGSAAYTAASAYEVPLTFSTGLTRTTNTITVNTSQNIATLSNLTSNGIVTTSGGTGALSVTGTTGSGSVVLATSPTLVTPVLGAATATSITAPTFTGTGAVSLSSGGSSGLSLDSASGRVTVATGDFLSTTVSGVSGAAAGDIWYDSAAGKYKINEAGTTKIVCNTTDAGCGAGGAGAFGVSAGLITKSTATDSLSLIYGDAGDVQLDITNITAGVAPTADAMQILLSGGSGIVTDNVDGLYINIEGADGTSTDVSGLHIDFDPVTGSSDDTFTGLLIDGVTGTAATENGLTIGAGWDTDINFIDTTPQMSLADNGTLILSDGSSTTNDIFQVGTAASRGNALVYGDLIVKGGTIARNLTGIIDVFVYDTSTDVDGGEWRNSLEMMQRSWAAETKDDGAGDPCVIATDDRCGNSAFPRKAIIATTADGLYIFDGADNSLWMKFTQAGTYALGANASNDPSGVAAQNGVVFVGTNGASGTGMYAIDFKQDAMYRYNTTNRSQADVNIGNRNTTATYATNPETGFAILNNVVNDVSVNVQVASMEGRAGTLIAPVDSQAGPLLGVTIVAAATDSGVSVINMGTRKVVGYSDATNDDYNQVYITKRGRMYATNETRAQLEEWRAVDTVIVTQVNGTPTRWYDETLAGNTPITLAGAVPTISTSPSALTVIERASSAREAAAAGQIDAGDVIFVGTNQGLAEVHTSGGTLPAASWSKVTTKDDATPYMNGSVRSVYLFDDASGATSTNSAVGTTGTTRNPLDQAGATAPTFGGSGIRGGAVNFNNNSYLCSDANADGTCDTDADIVVGTTSFTVSLWFKHSVTAAADVLFERCYTPATPAAAVGCIYAGMTATGTITAGIDDDATFTTVGTLSMDDGLTSAGTWNDNQWHHLVLTNTDTDLCMYIDGRLAVACDSTLAAAATLDGSQVLTIGGRCTGANCTTGDSFWDGQIDEFTWSAGATTGSGMIASSVNRRFLDGRTHMIRPSTTVTDATTFSSTTIGDSGESYVPNAFTSLVLEITGGTGAGQTRSIISNDTTTFTVYPAWTVTPDATSDYRVSPAKLYGSTNNVTTVAVDAPTQINKVRSLYVGTDDSADGGGVSVFSNAGAGGLKTEVYSSDSGVENDDLGTTWSGTGSDNIKAVSVYTDTIAFGTGTGVRIQRKDVSLKQLQADTLLALDDVRMSLVASGLFGATQDVLGLGQGADLAEYYYSNTPLEAGDVVSIQPDQPAGIDKASTRYQKNLLGVVSTRPGLTLGPVAENAYPIALSGRVPVKITNENGPIRVGDLLTSSSRTGYAMRATTAGPVIGRALNEPYAITSCSAELPTLTDAIQGEGPWVDTVQEAAQVEEQNNESMDSDGEMCGYVMLFVGLGESLGQDVEVLAEQFGALQGGQVTTNGITGDIGTQSSILSFLRSVKESHEEDEFALQSIFTDRIAAGVEILTPGLYADDIYTKTITALEGNKVELILNENGSFEVKREKEGIPVITLDSLGNAIFSGKITAAEIDSAKITGFDALITRMTALETLLQANAFDALTSVTTQNFKATGESTFEGQAQFKGLSFFTSTTTFDSSVLFNGPVEFTLPPLFNSDTAGFALIKEGDKKVRVTFDTVYAVTPVVAGEVTFEATDNIDEVTAEDLFEQDIRYLILEKDQTGFMILLNKPAPQNIRFSWFALGVRDPKIIESIFDGLTLDIPSAIDETITEETQSGDGEIEIPTVPEEEMIPVGTDSSESISTEESEVPDATIEVNTEQGEVSDTTTEVNTEEEAPVEETETVVEF